MVKFKAMLLLMPIIGVAIWYFFLQSSPKDQVLQQMRSLSEYVSKADGEKGTALLLKSQMIGILFADKCEVEVDLHALTGVYTPEEIGANLVRSRQFMDVIQLTFHDTTVTFPMTDQAMVATTGQMVGKLKNGDRIREVRELSIELKKLDGKWRFTACKIRDVLRK